MDHPEPTLLQAGTHTAISDRMRELLARAAQDHVYEQRTQGAVLDEIRQRLEGMEWLLREVRERELGGLSGVLEGVSSQVGELAARPPVWAEGLAQHVEIVGDRVDGVDGRLLDLSQRTERLEGGVLDLGEGLTETLASAIERLTGSVDRLAGRVEGMTAELAKAETRLSERLDGVDGHLAGLGRRLTDIEGHLTRHDDRFGAIDASFEDTGERLEMVDDRVEAVNQRVGQLPALLEVGEVHKRVGEIVQPTHNDLTRRLGALEETMLALAEALLRPTRVTKD